jgi:hypothetical protein
VETGSFRVRFWPFSSRPAPGTARGGRSPARRSGRLNILSIHPALLRLRQAPQPDKKYGLPSGARTRHGAVSPRPPVVLVRAHRHVPANRSVVRSGSFGTRAARLGAMASAAASAAAALARHVLLPPRYHASPPSAARRARAAPALTSASPRCVLRRVGRTPRYGTTGKKRTRRFGAPRAGMDMDLASGAVEVINDLGFDTLTFLGVTVLVVPAFRVVKASPVKYLSPPSSPPRLLLAAPPPPLALPCLHAAPPKCCRRFSASSAPASCSTSSASSGTSPTLSCSPSGESFSWWVYPLPLQSLVISYPLVWMKCF